jgi:hypothetical protein
MTTKSNTNQDPFRVNGLDMAFLLSASGSTAQTEEQKAAERQDELDEAHDLHAKFQQIFS